jgi:hypothetical protein
MYHRLHLSMTRLKLVQGFHCYNAFITNANCCISEDPKASARFTSAKLTKKPSLNNSFIKPFHKSSDL